MPLYELMAYLSFWAMPIAYMFSVGCCCDEVIENPCDQCDTGTESVDMQLTFDSVSNDNCTNCGDFNTTTFILAHDEVENFCRWIWQGTIPCDGETNPTCAIAFFANLGPFVPTAFRLTVFRDPGCGGGEAQGDIVETFPRDCGVDYTGQSIGDGVSQVHCSWTSATFDIAAI